MIKRFTYSVISTILFLLIMLLMIITVYGVVMRYFLRSPDVRVFFLSIWFWGFIFLLGFGHALYEKTHVFVDILYNRLSQAMQRTLRAFGFTNKPSVHNYHGAKLHTARMEILLNL